MPLKIIGAGFPRTGTTTLKKALQILGYNDTYHFKDLIAHPEKLKFWEELEATGSTDFESLFKGYVASVDFPGYPYYRILAERYPEAKVILTTRDLDAWYKSTHQTVWKAGPQTVPAKLILLFKMLFIARLRQTFMCIKFMRRVYLNKQFNGQFISEEHAKKVFVAHMNEVSKNIPAANLLVYQVSDGWEPLCKFLGHPIPDEEFPHLNKKEHFHAMVKGMINEASKRPVIPAETEG